jgi:queuine tRNA-ribosyltransferase
VTSSDRLTFDLASRDGEARTGTVTTARGSFATPCFMPVGTRAAVKHLAADDLEALGAEIMLGNTYHLMLRPGHEVIEELGGLHNFMGWRGHVLTDSGGYQIFSLEPKLDDDGATFISTYDGSTHRLTPERAAEVQCALGPDIQMVLDICPSLPSTTEKLQWAVDVTAAWAARARSRFLSLAEERPELNQFGIVQGGIDEGLRLESVERTVEVGFEGYAVGGLSVGEDKAAMYPVLATTAAALPADKPRYLMGVSDPVSLVAAVGSGIDMFDCVLPTRNARHGTVLTAAGRLSVRRLEFHNSDDPLDPDCGCSVCARYSRGYLRHLLQTREPTGARLISIHNLAWTFSLVEDIREAVRSGTLDALRRDVKEVWA